MVRILVVAVLQAVVVQVVALDQQVKIQDLALLLALETARRNVHELALEAAQLLQQQLLALLVAPAHNRWLALLPLQQRLQPQADPSAGANELLCWQLVAMYR